MVSCSLLPPPPPPPPLACSSSSVDPTAEPLPAGIPSHSAVRLPELLWMITFSVAHRCTQRMQLFIRAQPTGCRDGSLIEVRAQQKLPFGGDWVKSAGGKHLAFRFPSLFSLFSGLRSSSLLVTCAGELWFPTFLEELLRSSSKSDISHFAITVLHK